MRVLTTIALLLTTALIALGYPLPTFTDIERRWSAGESEATIHANHNIRLASPSWPLALDSHSSTQAESFDARTQQRQLQKRTTTDTTSAASSSSSSYSAALNARLRNFAIRLMKSKGESEMIEAREELAPVLKPRKIRYRWSS